ncbi:threonylcarbamoyl-AMP synthase [Candidatus Bathyarchaeota archaeon]|nr:threonylcarbamoyl-AMP synthase [Candidatus Bathyarchaeota archaeon]
MNTRIYKISLEKELDSQLEIPARILREGGLVAFPTETVYGLGANALNQDAVERIFWAKKRPATDPIIVHVSSKHMAVSLATKMPDSAWKLMDAHWPGPLTLIMQKNEKIPAVVTSHLPTIALRMPNHPIALQLIRQAGCPVAAPSANLFERPSPTLVAHILEDLDGRIDAIIDAGSTEIGIESTIVDVSGDVPMLLRPGGIPVDSIHSTIGMMEVHPSITHKHHGFQTISSGMEETHYAPDAQLILVRGQGERVKQRMRELSREATEKGLKVGILLLSNDIMVFPGAVVVRLGSKKKDIAQQLFQSFRKMNEHGVDIIITQETERSGLGLAINNRLMRAAKKIIETGT